MNLRLAQGSPGGCVRGGSTAAGGFDVGGPGGAGRADGSIAPAAGVVAGCTGGAGAWPCVPAALATGAGAGCICSSEEADAGTGAGAGAGTATGADGAAATRSTPASAAVFAASPPLNANHSPTPPASNKPPPTSASTPRLALPFHCDAPDAPSAPAWLAAGLLMSGVVVEVPASRGVPAGSPVDDALFHAPASTPCPTPGSRTPVDCPPPYASADAGSPAGVALAPAYAAGNSAADGIRAVPFTPAGGCARDHASLD
jgi:hypothetical protein